jgi:hypothetical protein
MKNSKRTITDAELDALLAGTPILPGDSFVQKTLIKMVPITEREVDSLLTADLLSISPDFTERTLERIHSGGSAMLFEFPAVRWLIRSGMAAAVILIGLFSYSMWQGQESATITTQVAKADISGMEYEELLYLEETLTSAKVLIELQKTVPLYFLTDEVDS